MKIFHDLFPYYLNSVTRLQEGVDYIPFIDVMKDDGVTLYELIDKFGCSELVYMSIGLPLGSKTETRLRVRAVILYSKLLIKIYYHSKRHSFQVVIYCINST